MVQFQEMDSSKVTDTKADTQSAPSAVCLSCGGGAFRSDRPYGNCCSMMCSLRGILTEAEEKEESERFKLYFKNMNRKDIPDAKE